MPEVAAPDFTYRIELNGSVPSQITVRTERTKPKTLVTLPRPAEDVSLVPAIATAILNIISRQPHSKPAKHPPPSERIDTERHSAG